MTQPDTTKRGRGRPPKADGALTNAQRQASFRAREKARGIMKDTVSSLKQSNRQLRAEVENLKRLLADARAALQRPGDHIHLDDYPNIRLLFWSTPGLHDVDRETMYSALDNGWKWIDWQSLLPEEQSLIDQLAIEKGNGWIGGRYVYA